MKNLYLFLGAIIFVANLIVGMVLTPYSMFNVGVNSVVIIANTIMMYVVASSTISDGFKVSLSLLLPLFTIVEFVLGIVAPDKFENNWYIIMLALLLTVEGGLYAIIYSVSKSTSK